MGEASDTFFSTDSEKIMADAKVMTMAAKTPMMAIVSLWMLFAFFSTSSNCLLDFSIPLSISSCCASTFDIADCVAELASWIFGREQFNSLSAFCAFSNVL